MSMWRHRAPFPGGRGGSGEWLWHGNGVGPEQLLRTFATTLLSLALPSLPLHAQISPPHSTAVNLKCDSGKLKHKSSSLQNAILVLNADDGRSHLAIFFIHRHHNINRIYDMKRPSMLHMRSMDNFLSAPTSQVCLIQLFGPHLIISSIIKVSFLCSLSGHVGPPNHVDD